MHIWAYEPGSPDFTNLMHECMVKIQWVVDKPNVFLKVRFSEFQTQ